RRNLGAERRNSTPSGAQARQGIDSRAQDNRCFLATGIGNPVARRPAHRPESRWSLQGESSPLPYCCNYTKYSDTNCNWTSFNFGSTSLQRHFSYINTSTASLQQHQFL